MISLNLNQNTTDELLLHQIKINVVYKFIGYDFAILHSWSFYCKLTYTMRGIFKFMNIISFLQKNLKPDNRFIISRIMSNLL